MTSIELSMKEIRMIADGLRCYIRELEYDAAWCTGLIRNELIQPPDRSYAAGRLERDRKAAEKYQALLNRLISKE